METTGFKIKLLTYYNFILLPLIAGVRIAQRLLPISSRTSDLKAHNPAINSLLLRLFSSERYVLDRVNVPIGTSLLVVATKELGLLEGMDGARDVAIRYAEGCAGCRSW